MKFIFLSIFVICTVLHLYARLKELPKLKNITKIFILLPLLFFYIFSVEEVNIFIVLAIIFSWLGDILLIPHGIKWFAIGGVCFLASHIFFIMAYHQYVNYDNLDTWVIIVLSLLVLAVVSVIFIYLKEYLNKVLVAPMFIYLVANGTMNAFALFNLISNFSEVAIIICLGAILFFISDTSLFFVRFNKNSRMKTHFLVMLTYSLGEFLIILGLTLI